MLQLSDNDPTYQFAFGTDLLGTESVLQVHLEVVRQ